MGTYTTNYNLFMPSIGEQGWGDLVNGNFSTIDNTMKGLDTRTGTLESEMNVVKGRVTTLENTAETYGSRITTLESGVFDSVTTNKLYLPLSSSYSLKIIKTNGTSFSFKTKAWSSNSTTKSYTVKNLYTALSNVIQQSNYAGFTVIVRASITDIYGTSASLTVKLNGTTMYTISGSSGKSFSTTLYNVVDTDVIEYYGYLSFPNASQSTYEAYFTGTLNIVELGI